jgi:predicted ribosome quality control (RQC) complex YloA/Tae2 family protein
VNLSYFALRRLCDEIRTACEGRRILGAAITAPNTIALDVGTEGLPAHRLTLSGSRTRGRVTLFYDQGPLRGERLPWFDRYLDRALIAEVRQVPMERILELHLLRRDRVGGEYRSRLVAEVMGRFSNVLLVAPDDRILAVLRPQPSEERPHLPGRTYLLPAPQARPVISSVTPESLLRALAADGRPPATALARAIAGLDPLTTAEWLHRVGLPGVVPDAAAADLLAALRALFDAPPFAPGASFVPGQGGGISPFDLTHAPPGLVACESVSAAVDCALAAEEEASAAKGRARDLAREIEVALRSARTKQGRIAEDLAEASRADRMERWGGLILSQLDRIPARAAEVTLPDLFADGTAVTIPLDPDRTAVDNGESYLRRASKARKAAPVLTERLAEVDREVLALEQALSRASGLEDDEAADALRAELAERGVVRPRRQKQRPAAKEEGDGGGPRPRRYRTRDGWEVWVGRNDRENDAITRGAPRNDIWLHAQGCPGSHVILRRKSPDSAPTPDALHDAACLAAFWSKARGARTVPVSYTEVRYVQKPRGAPPGQVTIRNEKTLFVHPRELPRADA